MKISTVSSMIAMAITAAVLAVMRFGMGDGGGLTDGLVWDLGVIVVGSAVIGLAIRMALGILIDSELDGLRRHVEMLGYGETKISTFEPRQWLLSLNESIIAAMDRMSHRSEQLSNRRRELEIQLRIADAERQQIEAILHSISDAVLVTDAFNELTLANDAAARTLYFDLSQSRHQPIDRVVNDESLVKLIKDARERGSGHHLRHIEHQIGHQGHNHIYDVSLASVSNSQREVSGVVTVLRDVTREKEIAEMKSDFVSSVSHELRTPLSSIKAYIEMLIDGEADDEPTRKEFCNIIQSETNRLNRLIDNVLNISRIEAGIVKVHREPINLSQVVGEVVEVMRPQARAKQLQITELSETSDCSVYADRDMICQAVMNLVGNAIKYTSSGGQITVECTVDDLQRTGVIRVHDTGIGIPHEAQSSIFEKFYRIADHKKMAKGTGLGLNLVKHIVETIHTGRIDVVSKVGAGSTFSIALPLVQTVVSSYEMEEVENVR